LDFYATPMFKVSYYNQGIIEVSDPAPRWSPPEWFPVDRYQQYQSGYLGATPYVVSDYSNLNKDYED